MLFVDYYSHKYTYTRILTLLLILLVYPRRWGLGPMAQRKKSMIQEGKLDKHGKPNSNTPSDYLQSYKDFSKTKAPELVGADADSKPAAAVEAMVVEETVVAEAAVVVVDKKREANDDAQDETPRKKEKKEKKKKKDKKKKKEKA